MANAKFVKTAAAVALGASVVTTAVAPGAASAATSYKIKDGKLYKNGKIAKGYVVYKGTLYKNGKKNKGYAKVGTGSSMKLYYNTKLKKGFKTANNATLLFKDGVLYKGYKQAGSNERLYKDGKLTTGWIVYTNDEGTKYLYSKGYLYKGLKTATRSGVKNLFENGVLAEGTKEYKDELFTDGVIDTKEQVFQDTLYVDGKKAQGSKLFEDTLYVDGKLPTEELNKFGEGDEVKYYGKDGKLANGEFELDGKKVTIKDGVIADELVTAVEATTLNTVTVKFGKEVEKAEASNFAVANKATGEKQVVKSVTLAEDKKSATVEFYSNLASDTTYTVNTTIGEEKASNELAIASLEVTSIEADATQAVLKGSTVAYKLFTSQGIEIKKEQLNKQVLSFEGASAVVNADGVIQLAEGTTGKVTIKVTNEDKTVAAEKEVTVSAVATTLKSVGTVTTNNDFEKPSTTIFGSTGTVAAQFVDQFGTKYVAADLATKFDGATVAYESQNLDVAVVDKATGKLTALKEGTVPVKVSVLDKEGKVIVSKTVEVTVKGAQVATTVTTDKNAALLSTKGGTQDFVATVKDQYGQEIATKPTAKVYTMDKDGQEIEVNDSSVAANVIPVADKTGEYTVTVTAPAAATAGEYTVKLAAGDKAATTLKVTVKAPGTSVDYKLNVANTVDLKDATATATDLLDTPTLDTVDAEGLVTGTQTATFKVTGTDKVEYKDGKFSVVAGKELKVGDTFTVEAVVGLDTVKSQVVTVVDTSAKYTADFTNYTLTATADKDTLAKTLNNVAQVSIDGKKVEGYNVTAAKFVTTDSAVVAANGNLAIGTATVLVSEITVEKDSDSQVIKFANPVKFTVNVTAAK